jgi:membrane-associated phospholipid phosphatase
MNTSSPVRVRSRDRLRTAMRRFGVRGLLAFIAVLLAAVPFGLLVLLLRAKASWLGDADIDTANALHSYALDHRGFTKAMKVLSFIGSSPVWIVLLGAVFLWLLSRRLKRLAVFVALTAIGSSVLNGLIKTAVGRARPALPDPVSTAIGKSFPSGHTQSAVVGYGILLLVFLPAIPVGRRVLVGAFAALMVLLIGFSRIALGVHYLSDVIGGVIIGFAWLLMMTAAFSGWRRDLGKRPVEAKEGLEPEHADRLK